MKKISIVVSVYNEEAALPSFYEAAKLAFDALSWDYEIIFVNDGSRDRSGEILDGIADKDPKARVLHFSRNFGHEAAMIAGIDAGEGDAFVCMDADLQHPVECVAEIIAKFEEGYEIINMVRTENISAGLVKNITSKAFYKLINHVSDIELLENASDFFAITKNVAEVLRENYRERVRFLRGYVQNVGFNKTSLDYVAAARVAGQSKYSIKKLFKFSINTILCFSELPLKLGIYSGLGVGLLGLILMIYTIYCRIVYGTPTGYATIVVVLCFMFAMLFMLVGIIGEYIAIIFTELKDRPIYIVSRKKNIGPDNK